MTEPALRPVRAMPVLRANALKLCRNVDAALDLVQETMLRALASRHLFEQGTNLDAWLMTIERNLFLTEQQKRWREVEDADGMIAKTVPIEDNALRKIEARQALQLVDRLPRSFRVPVRLIADGATYEEIAAEICEQVGTVKSRVNRARVLLKAAEGDR